MVVMADMVDLVVMAEAEQAAPAMEYMYITQLLPHLATQSI
jgi:hypothetical protein